MPGFSRREWALGFAAGLTSPLWAMGQDAQKKNVADDVQDLPGPEPIPPAVLSKPLPTVPVRAGSPAFNLQMVDTSLQPADRQGLWVLDFSFKPIRLRTVEIPGKGRRVIYYMYYKIVNRTGEPRLFVPQLSIVTNTGKRYDDVPLPQAVKLIQAREDPSTPLLGSVDQATSSPASACHSMRMI